MDLEQDTNQIYNAFAEAGLGAEARQMSTQKIVNGVLRIVPGLGHYIAFLDSFCYNACNNNLSIKESPKNAKATHELVEESRENIKKFVENQSDRIKDKLKQTLPAFIL